MCTDAMPDVFPTTVIPVGVATFAAAEALGGVLGAPQPSRDDLRRDIQQAVHEAVAGAQQGADAAGRAAVDAQRLTDELRRAQEAVAQLAPPPSTGGNLSVTREGNNIIIHAPDGRVITLDQTIVPPAAIEGLVSSLGMEHGPMQEFPHERGPSDNTLKLVGVLGVCFTIMVIMVAWARAFGRRVTANAAVAGATPPDLGLRLERIEQAVDAMAVEMERVSEAQRYSARLLTERLPEGAPQLAGAARAHDHR